MPAPSGGRVSRGVNPFSSSGKTVAHSAKAWAAIRSAWAKAPYNQPAYDPMKSLSGKSLYDAVNQITSQNLKTANQPHEANIAQAKGEQQGISDRLGAYDKLVGGQLQGIASNARQLEGEDQNRIAQNAQQAADRLNQTGTGINTELNADQANRGPGLGGGARDQIQQELAAQKQYGASTAGTNSLLAGQLGSSLSGLTNTMVGTAAMRGQQSQGDVANKYAQMIGKERGAEQANIDKLPSERTNLLLSLRDKEFTRAATTQKLNLQGQQIQNTAANNAAKLRLAGKQLTEKQQNDLANQKLRKLGITSTNDLGWARLSESQRHNRASEINQANSIAQRGQGKGGKGKGLTPNEQNQITKSINQAWSFDPTRAGIYGALTMGSSIASGKDKKGNRVAGYKYPTINPTFVQAAWELRRYGFIDSGTANALSGLGYNIPGGWRAPNVSNGQLNRGSRAG